MNLQRDVLLSNLLLLLTLIILPACSTSDSGKSSDQGVTFEVIDSLLEPVYAVESAGKSFCPPIGFEPVHDSLLEVLSHIFAEHVDKDAGMKLVQFFFNAQHSSGLIVSTIEGMDLQADTADYISKYRQLLFEKYGVDNVTYGNYWIDSVYVENFLVTDSVNVRFNLLCLSRDRDAVELQYIISRPYYPEIIKAVESSIGSLKPIQQGG